MHACQHMRLLRTYACRAIVCLGWFLATTPRAGVRRAVHGFGDAAALASTVRRRVRARGLTNMVFWGGAINDNVIPFTSLCKASYGGEAGQRDSMGTPRTCFVVMLLAHRQSTRAQRLK